LAIRFDTAGEGLTITTSPLNYNADYTIAGWFRMATDTNAFTTLIGLFDSGGSQYDALETAADGTTLHVIANRTSSADTSVGALTVGTWYYIALVRSSTSVAGYIITEAGGVTTASATLATGGNAVANNRIGQWSDASELFNGRVAQLKAWTAALTQAELLNEMRTVRPQRLANLRAYWPCLPVVTEALRDYSGNGHPWTAAGTISYEDDPPVPWGVALFLVGQATAPPSQIDTRNKRASAIAAALSFLVVPPLPDGTINTQDRQHLGGWIYRGWAADITTKAPPPFQRLTRVLSRRI